MYKINPWIFICVIVVLLGFIFLRSPEVFTPPDPSTLKDLAAQDSIKLDSLKNEDIKIDSIELKIDSIDKIGDIENEIYKDSINSISYLPIDDNIELLPILLSSEDSSFRRYIDSCNACLHKSDK